VDWWFDGRHLKGLALRYFLALYLLEAGGERSTRELVDAVHAAGFELHGRASKTVSDALRWEVRRGRVVRRGRGVYAAGVIARSTRGRMRTWVAHFRAQVVARM
jgi:hypothetical protein